MYVHTYARGRHEKKHFWSKIYNTEKYRILGEKKKKALSLDPTFYDGKVVDK